MPFESLDEIKKALPQIRARFEMEVEAAALEVTHIAKDISSAIGEISITEAKAAIVREFIDRLSK